MDKVHRKTFKSTPIHCSKVTNAQMPYLCFQKRAMSPIAKIAKAISVLPRFAPAEGLLVVLPIGTAGPVAVAIDMVMVTGMAVSVAVRLYAGFQAPFAQRKVEFAGPAHIASIR